MPEGPERKEVEEIRGTPAISPAKYKIEDINASYKDKPGETFEDKAKRYAQQETISFGPTRATTTTRTTPYGEKPVTEETMNVEFPIDIQQHHHDRWRKKGTKPSVSGLAMLASRHDNVIEIEHVNKFYIASQLRAFGHCPEARQ